MAEFKPLLAGVGFALVTFTTAFFIVDAAVKRLLIGVPSASFTALGLANIPWFYLALKYYFP